MYLEKTKRLIIWNEGVGNIDVYVDNLASYILTLHSS
jgi:hypothetical protein